MDRYATKCGCSAEPVIDLEHVILDERCARCGGIVRSTGGSVYQIGHHIQAMITDLHRLLGNVASPGKARVSSCPDCLGDGCPACGGTGNRVWNACVQEECDGILIACLNQHDESDGLICLKCRFVWNSDDPRWQAQKAVPGQDSVIRKSPLLAS